jgi:antirestriction protein ArdC
MIQVKITAEQAKSFGKASANSIGTIYAQRKCNCDPYTDWFTFNRWIAQGQCVSKGSHGIKLCCYAPGETKLDEKKGEYVAIPKWYSAYVFCRCQVQPLENKKTANNAPVSTITNSQPNDITAPAVLPSFLNNLFAANVSSARGQ